MEVRGESAAEVLGLLDAIEQEVASITPVERLRTAYMHAEGWVHIGAHLAWLADIQVWKAAIRIALQGSPVTAFKHLLGGCVVGRTRVQASSINIKNNILALYPDLGLVCKVHRSQGVRDHQALFNEYQTLQMLSTIDGVNAPRPLEFNDRYAPALLMSFQAGCGPTRGHWEEAALAFAQQLFSVYEHVGVEVSCLRDDAVYARYLDGGMQYLQGQGWAADEAELICGVLARYADEPVLSSRIHGDAGLGNTLQAADGQLQILDWELSRSGLIAHDMCKLIADCEVVRPVYVSWRASYLQSGEAGTLRELAVVDLLIRLDLHDARDYFVQRSAGDLAYVDMKLGLIRTRVRQLCEGLG